ncbi:hypothetical protein M2132_000958 [Dysgonomonas sp. PH5-45]|uniref:hypothetical protein n=1 Tax=unclassified Dysgonomonas TaxID=2630389 RepID=UPI002475D1D7|nr:MULTISPECIES: hypothetical protein [unclassified Dysgonomonas]MDH6354630.1 hypothetical protein [Dysgonomonas sp. PH5-45]MDH6387528.1 hypothetical protein [Dysgonomonas sp. PH5-37]
MATKIINPRYYLRMFNKVLMFAATPTIEWDRERNERERSCDNIVLLIINIIVSALLILTVNFINDASLVGHNFFDLPFNEILRALLYIMIFSLLVESAFRLPLKFASFNLSLSGAIIIYFVISLYNLYFKFNIDFRVIILTALICGGVINLIVRFYRNPIKGFWENNFGLICYTYAALYVAIGITVPLVLFNFPLPMLILYGVLLLWQSMLYSYIRTNYGIAYNFGSNFVCSAFIWILAYNTISF